MVACTSPEETVRATKSASDGSTRPPEEESYPAEGTEPTRTILGELRLKGMWCLAEMDDRRRSRKGRRVGWDVKSEAEAVRSSAEMERWEEVVRAESGRRIFGRPEERTE